MAKKKCFFCQFLLQRKMKSTLASASVFSITKFFDQCASTKVSTSPENQRFDPFVANDQLHFFAIWIWKRAEISNPLLLIAVLLYQVEIPLEFFKRFGFFQLHMIKIWYVTEPWSVYLLSISILILLLIFKFVLLCEHLSN